MVTAHKIRPCLWFDGNAEEAVDFYCKIFRNSEVLEVSRYGDAGPGPKGSVLTLVFQLDGLELIALNGGPEYPFTEAISLSVDCQSQAEVDELWEKLGAGGEPGQCGWLEDRFGLSWQIVPSVLPRLLTDPDAAKTNRVMQAMFQMRKLDIAKLERAAAGR